MKALYSPWRSALAVSLLAAGCGVDPQKVTQPTDPLIGSIANATESDLVASLAAQGCLPATGGSNPVVEVRARNGGSVRFECRHLEVDSLLALGRTYSYQPEPREGLSSISTGYWGYETVWREYCLIDLADKHVIGCGIWLATDVPKWFGETEQSPFDEWWDSPGNTGVLNATSAPQVDEKRKDCDQNTQKDCLKPLSVADRALVANALAAYARPESEFTDNDAKLACATLVWNVEYALQHDPGASEAERILWIGATNSHDHGGQGTLASGGVPGKGHVDPRYFIRARASTTGMKELAMQVMHEMAHSVGGNEHNNANNLRNQNPNTPMDYSTSPPFSYLHATSGVNTCVKW